MDWIDLPIGRAGDDFDDSVLGQACLNTILRRFSNEWNDVDEAARLRI